MNDLYTMIWKESREYLYQRENVRSSLGMWLIPVLILGIIFPLQYGSSWVTSPLTIISWVWVPLLIVARIIADSFAGERERHTLETLLASRLSDTTILMGKIIASMLYALATAVLIMVVGLITVNVTNRGSGILLYPASVVGAGLAISIIVAMFASTIGVLVSMRAKTVRQAAQTLSLAIILLGFSPGLIITLMPKPAKDALGIMLESVDLKTIAYVIFGALIIADMVLLAITRRIFRRNRLLA